MKKVCVIGSNLYELSDTIMSFIKSEKGFKNYIIVPDKFSLLAELSYFENSKTKCTFDTEVISISKLAYSLLDKIGVSVNVITSQQQALLVKKAIKNCKDNLSVIKTNVNSGFYTELSKTISQLKASKVDLTKYDSISVAKINDFKLIISEYEKLLKGNQDNNDLLTILEENLTKCKFLENCRFYFVGFDSFTTQAFDILKQISKISDICVGALVAPNENMKDLYDLDIYNKLKTLGNFEILMSDKSLNFNQSLIENNLFSNKRYFLQKKNEFLKVSMAKNENEEVSYVFNVIANKLSCGENLSDYSVAVAGLENYIDILEENAVLYNLPVYIDSSLCLKDSLLYRFIDNIFDLILSGFSKEYVINFWFSDFVKIDVLEKSDIINTINEFSLYDKNFFKIDYYLSENAQKYYEKLLDFIKKLKKCEKIQNIYENIVNLLQNFECENIINEICEQFKNDNQLKNEKLYLQVYQKFTNGLEQLCNILSDYDFVLSEFKDDFATICENIKISTVPISSNCIYIGDASDNFFAKTKHLFVIGASGEALPKTVYNCGLILDEDIQNIKELKNVSPTINMINKRNKFKVYNLCLCPSQSLNLSYCLTEAGKDIPCYFVSELMEIFAVEKSDIFNVSQYFDFVDANSQVEYTLNNLNNKQIAISTLLNSISKSYNDEIVSNSLYNILKDKMNSCLDGLNFDNNKQNILNTKNMFFVNNRTKITQIEDYFNCPYLHFVRHGLKLKENNSCEIDAKDFGNVLHFVAESFLNQKDEDIKNEKIDMFLDKCFEKITNLDKFKKFNLNSANKIFLKFLKDESYDLCKALIVHKNESDFNCYKPEFSFLENIEDLQIKGFIDRIDFCKTKDENGQNKTLCRIVDYKSGNPSISLKDLYCGLQIQPAVYGAIIKKKFGDCSGIFLMPLKNQKSKDNYKLKGFYKKDINVVRKMENTLSFDNPNGKLINAKISVKKENVQKGIYELSNTSGIENFDSLLEYSIDLAKDAIKNIKNGEINCVPYEGRCETCQYHSICNFDKLYKNKQRQLSFEVTEQSFLNKNK